MWRALDDDASSAALEGAGDAVVIRVRSAEGWDRACALAAQARRVAILAALPPAPSQLTRAVRAGVRELGLVLSGARPEVHDWHARAPGSFASTLRALDEARSLRMRAGVATPLTRSNARVLGELPSVLAASGAALWVVIAPRAREGPEPFTARVPRFGLGVPPMLAALERARRLGLTARTLGWPACTLGPFANAALPAAPRAHAEPCEGCASRARCAGVDPAYLLRFGPGELRSVDAPPPEPPGDGFAEVFLGADEWLA